MKKIIVWKPNNITTANHTELNTMYIIRSNTNPFIVQWFILALHFITTKNNPAMLFQCSGIAKPVPPYCISLLLPGQLFLSKEVRFISKLPNYLVHIRVRGTKTPSHCPDTNILHAGFWGILSVICSSLLCCLYAIGLSGKEILISASVHEGLTKRNRCTFIIHLTGFF